MASRLDPSSAENLPPSGASPTPAPNTPAVSKLAAKVAHELNNPLDAVLRFVSLAQRKAKSGDYADLDRHLADAQFGLQRMAEILRELMDIGRQTHGILARGETFPVDDLILRATRTIAAQAEQKSVRLITENNLFDQPLPPFDLRLAQILANLLKNAIEAAPEQSDVHLTLSRISDGGPHPSLCITVEDTGPGIPTDLLPQLFMHFVTTKPSGAGHGLGLAISRELALSLGGTLFIDNRPTPATGCIATLLLPLS